MKKALLLFLVLLVLLAACALSVADEPPAWRQCGPYRYIRLEDGTARIERYSGDEAVVYVPAELDGFMVTEIGDGAFVPFGYDPYAASNPPGPSRIILPEGVRSIGNRAFSHCGALESVTIPDSVVSIGDCIFWYSGTLTGVSLTIPEGLAYLGSCPYPCFSEEQIQALSNHPYLEIRDGLLFSKPDSRLICCLDPSEITRCDIPEGTRIIGDYAFAFSKLETVRIPDTVTAIGDYAFYRSALQAVTVPGSVISVGDYAFAYCPLAEAVLSEGVASLGDCAFSECADLAEIRIPDSLVRFGSDPFLGAGVRVPPCYPNFIFSEESCLEIVDGMLFDKENHQLIKCLNVDNATFRIPDGTEIIGGTSLKCRILPEGARIPDSVREIDYQAFADSYDPESMSFTMYKPAAIESLPGSLEIIGPEAFRGSWIADSLVIPDGVKSVGESAFRGSTLAGVTVSGSVREIPRLAFAECRKLSFALLQDGVSVIGDRAFWNSGLSLINFPDSIVYIGDEAFRDCSFASSLALPDHLSYIGSWALDAGGLETLTIPDSVTGVGIHPFNSRTELAVSPDHPYLAVTDGALIEKKSGRLISVSGSVPDDYTIPDGVRLIGDYAFYEIDLSRVVIPEGVTEIGSHAFMSSRRSPREVVLPSTLKVIGSYAFADSYLANVVIPDGTETIGDYAFYYNPKLETAVIPESVTYIGQQAFGRCKYLTLTVVPGSYAEQYCKENGLYCVNP